MTNPKVRFLFAVAAAWAMTAVVSMAAPPPIILAMDDLASQPINGLAHPKGVQFGFTVNGAASVDARYASGGPGSTAFIEDPSIEGTTAGVMSLVFATPTPLLEFGVARSILANVTNGVAVQLFDAANASLGVTNLALTTQPMFAEAQFEYGGVPVKRATLNFTSASAALGGDRFAFDNLIFSVPEPCPITLAATVLVAGFRHRRLS